VLSKDDECIFVNTQGGHDLWITGNVCVDMEFSAVIARGTDAGTLYVVNNTFVREGHVGLSAVRREQGARPVVLRNNAYLANAPTALAPDLTGTGFDIAFETVSGSPLCTSCTSATIDAASVADVADPMVANQAGVRPDDFTPRAGSPLVDSGTDLLDRNGTAPGRFTGAGPDRGAIEAR